jgi:S-layer protein
VSLAIVAPSNEVNQMAWTFNSQYYLQNNPDVFIALNNGLIPSAEWHYLNYGWKEGRNPNSVFDTSYYLLQNSDVQAAGINPLVHFERWGAAEGRAPSAAFVSSSNFDEARYLTDNPDVADAGMDAFAHYALYGWQEARSAYTNTGVEIIAGYPGGVPGDTFTLTAGVDSLSGTAGNDTFQATNATINPFDAVNGNDGYDTFNVIATETASLDSRTNFQNVEVINIDQSTNVLTNINAAQFQGAQEIWQIGNATDIYGVGSTTAIGFRDTTTNGLSSADDVITFTGSSGSIILDNVTVGAGAGFGVSGENITTLNVSGSTDVAGTLTIDAAPVANISTLNLALSSDITLVGNVFLDAKNVDASASTGNLTFGTTAVELAFANDLTLTSGAGDDTINLTAADTEARFTVNGGAGFDLITTGAYNDTINGGEGNDIITGGAGADTITLGSGKDVVRYTEIEDSSGTTVAAIDTITDFSLTDDTFDLSEISSLTSVADADTQASIENAISGLSSGATLTDAFAAATSVTTDGQAAWFSFGGDTYVVGETNGPDLAIRLAGSLQLTPADFLLI